MRLITKKLKIEFLLLFIAVGCNEYHGSGTKEKDVIKYTEEHIVYKG